MVDPGNLNRRQKKATALPWLKSLFQMSWDLLDEFPILEFVVGFDQLVESRFDVDAFGSHECHRLFVNVSGNLSDAFNSLQIASHRSGTACSSHVRCTD